MAVADTAGRPTARRTVLAGAGLAAGASLVTGLEGAAYGATDARLAGAPLLSTQARHLVGRFSYGVTPALARQVRARGGAQKWFEWQLTPGRVKDTAGDALDSWFPHLKWSPAQDRRRERQRPGRRLGGDGGLPELAAAATDEEPAAGARDHGRVLGEPLQRAGERRRRLHLAGALRERDPGPRPRLVRVAAPGRHRPSGHGHLPRQRRLRQGPSQREPGPRAARAAHGRARRGLHRGERRRLGPHPDRLAGRPVGHLGRLLRPRLARPPAGPRPRLPQPEQLSRRPPGHPRLPPLPRTPPGDRPAHRRQAGARPSSATTRRGPWSTTWPRSTSRTAPGSGPCSRRWWARRPSGTRWAPRSGTPRTTWWRPTA